MQTTSSRTYLALGVDCSVGIAQNSIYIDADEYDTREFDAQLGLDGLHRVQKKVEPRPRKKADYIGI